MKKIIKKLEGVTLVELVITSVLLSAMALLVMGPFRYMATSTQRSKEGTLANNLAQEKVEILKNKSYYSLLVTTSTTNDTNFSPAISYDSAGYPPETLVQGGISFTRATRVDFAYQSGTTVSTTAYTSDDTGMKQITIYVMWRQGTEWKKQTLVNLVSNVSTSQLNARILGTVTNASGGAAISGAYVHTVENPDYYGWSNGTGNYSFNVAAGTYTIVCTTTPFYSYTTPSSLAVGTGGTLTQNFSLTAIASAPVTTDVYIQDHVVISQVVAATNTLGADMAIHEIEYVELFNPTPNPVNVGQTGHVNQNIDLMYYDENSTHNKSDTDFNLVYVTTYIPANSYYLIANSPSFDVDGTMVTVNAYYSAPYVDYIKKTNAGAVRIANHTTGTAIDTVGWRDIGNLAPEYETAFVNLFASDGLPVGSQVVRMSYPGSYLSTYGPAYDSDDNSLNFVYNIGATVEPKTAATSKTVLTGTPATGAWVNLTDTLSQGGVCATTLIAGLYPACRFTTYAATGTWSAIAYSLGSTSSFYKEIATVTVASGFTTSFPNATTSPTWLSSPYNHTLLNTTTDYAFVAGTVYNVFGSPLNGITVAGGGRSTVTSSSGRYFLSLPAGAVQVTANYGNSSPSYSSESLSLVLTAGSLTDGQNFNLAQAGVLRGYFKTTSSVPLPNRVAVALQGFSEVGQATSDGSGYFYIRNISTGTYTVAPALDPIESVSPSSASVTLSAAGTTVFVGTFTISNGLANIAGQVTSGGQAIRTGVLIMATTSTLAGGASTPAPSLSGVGSCSPCYYETSSDALGAYNLELRSSATAYKLYGWYSVTSGTATTTTRVGPYTVNVTTASTTVTQNLSW